MWKKEKPEGAGMRTYIYLIWILSTCDHFEFSGMIITVMCCVSPITRSSRDLPPFLLSRYFSLTTMRPSQPSLSQNASVTKITPKYDCGNSGRSRSLVGRTQGLLLCVTQTPCSSLPLQKHLKQNHKLELRTENCIVSDTIMLAFSWWWLLWQRTNKQTKKEIKKLKQWQSRSQQIPTL